MKVLLLVLAVVVGAIAGALGYMGAFGKVKVEEREMGPYSFVYVQEASTDFGKIGQLTEALGERLQKAGYTQRQPAQVYYAAGRGIQNQVGFMVERAPGNEVLGTDTFFRPISVQRCMVVRFPFRNPASFALGHWRVDRALARHRAERKYAETHAIVILDGDAILYLQPIEPA